MVFFKFHIIKFDFESLTLNIHQVLFSCFSTGIDQNLILLAFFCGPEVYPVTTKCHIKCTEPARDFLPRSYMPASNQNFILDAITRLSNKLLSRWYPSTRRTVMPALKRKEKKRNPSVWKTLIKQTNIFCLFSY